MPFTAPVLNIGGGLADGILAGSNALGKAISYVGEQYANAKAAEGTMGLLSSMKGSDGSPVVDQEMMNKFASGSLSAKQQMLGVILSKAMLGWQTQQKQSLQENEGQVEQNVHSANTEADYQAAGKRGLLPANAANPARNPATPQTPTETAGGAPPAQNGTSIPGASNGPGALGYVQKTVNGKNYYIDQANGRIFDVGSGQWMDISSLAGVK